MSLARALFLVAAAWLLKAPHASSEVPACWTPQTSLQVRSIEAVVPSPDGRRAAFVQSTPVVAGDRSFIDARIYVGASDGSGASEVARCEPGAAPPSFSPDGRNLYFVSTGSGKGRVNCVRSEGGVPQTLAMLDGRPGGFRVSPDGRTIAVIAYAPGRNTGVGDEPRVVTEDPGTSALYLLSTATPGAEPRRILTGPGYIANLDWSPDGRKIVYEFRPSARDDDWKRAHVAEIECANGVVDRLDDTRAAERSPLYSPDGRHIAWVRSDDRPSWAMDHRIALFDRATHELRLLPATPDANPGLLGWSEDSQRILFREIFRTRAAFYEMTPDGRIDPLYRPVAGMIGASALNLRSRSLGFVYEDSRTASEAFVMPLSSRVPRRISDANRAVKDLIAARTTVIRWTAKNGTSIEGLLTYPNGYRPGRKYPLILIIHGGPMDTASDYYIGRLITFPLAALSCRGYLILRPNPRGSGGYGRDFRFATIGDWGGKDYDDDIGGVDYLISTGVADSDRLGVMGSSYGGYMTNWVITQTQRFKAAVVWAGISDLLSFELTTDEPSFVPDYFRSGSGQFRALEQHSPVTFASRVKTPTLIMHGEADTLVPPGQASESYHAIRFTGTESQMVLYPRTGHVPHEPKLILDIERRTIEWMDRHLR